MPGFRVFLHKEFTETVRTWRIWVVPGLLLFFAATSPLLAQLTPALLESVAQGQSGVRIIVPDPTYLDAYAQWLKNLQQVVAFALLLTAGGMIAGEVSGGTAVLVLTKPLSRPAFVAAKFVSSAVLLVTFTVAGAGTCWGVTRALFGEAPVAPLVQSTASWLAFALFLLALMTLFSAAFSTLAAGGAGIAAFFALSVLQLWGPAVRFSPAGLSSAAGGYLAGSDVAIVSPAVSTVVMLIAVLAGAVAVFGRREL